MLVFLKLGGSLITDKGLRESARSDTIMRVAAEIREALTQRSDLQLLIGHGSGSFGHSAAQQYGTHRGVVDQHGWYGFARVSVVAARLNAMVLDALDAAGVPVFRVQPSASALCREGALTELALHPIQSALAAGLVPLVYGDVAFDLIRGGTIISTEQIFDYLALRLAPARLLLAGDYDGVRDAEGNILPKLTSADRGRLEGAITGSAHPDVTGGMAAKVDAMLALCRAVPGLTVQVFSGVESGIIQRTLVDNSCQPGTCISGESS